MADLDKGPKVTIRVRLSTLHAAQDALRASHPGCVPHVCPGRPVRPAEQDGDGR